MKASKRNITKPMKNYDLLKRARGLVDTSVKHVRVQLNHYKTLNDLRVALMGYHICRTRCEKTKMQILDSKIKRMRKDIGLA